MPLLYLNLILIVFGSLGPVFGCRMLDYVPVCTNDATGLAEISLIIFSNIFIGGLFLFGLPIFVYLGGWVYLFRRVVVLKKLGQDHYKDYNFYLLFVLPLFLLIFFVLTQF